MKPKSLLLAVGCLLILVSVCDACPTCKQAISEGGADHEQVIRGYFWSILFMMSMPFIIFTSLCTYFYVLVRKARLLEATGVVGSATLS